MHSALPRRHLPARIAATTTRASAASRNGWLMKTRVITDNFPCTHPTTMLRTFHEHPASRTPGRSRPRAPSSARPRHVRRRNSRHHAPFPRPSRLPRPPHQPPGGPPGPPPAKPLHPARPLRRRRPAAPRSAPPRHHACAEPHQPPRVVGPTAPCSTRARVRPRAPPRCRLGATFRHASRHRGNPAPAPPSRSPRRALARLLRSHSGANFKIHPPGPVAEACLKCSGSVIIIHRRPSPTPHAQPIQRHRCLPHARPMPSRFMIRAQSAIACSWPGTTWMVNSL